MEAREREGMIAHRADVMFRLPHAATLDAGPCVQRIDDAPPEDVPRDRGVGMKRPPCDWRRTSDSPAAVSPKRCWNRGPVGRNSVADVMEMSNCSASGN